MPFTSDLRLYWESRDYRTVPATHLGPAHLASRIACTQKVVWKGQQITLWKPPRRAVGRRNPDCQSQKRQQKV
uniref:Uncharacterized protein n=1 Tax=Ixodes ricinus TaxID=34613 RepID=A0A147BUH1_IXORI